MDSAKVIMVLLKDAWTWAMPSATVLVIFLRVPLAPGLAIVTSYFNINTALRRSYTKKDSLFGIELLANRFARALTGTCICLGALTAQRQTATMTQTAVAAQIHQTLDVH